MTGVNTHRFPMTIYGPLRIYCQQDRARRNKAPYHFEIFLLTSLFVSHPTTCGARKPAMLANVLVMPIAVPAEWKV